MTKDGSLAGPKVLEHMIDCSLMLEGSSDSHFRTLRSNKNRFGAVNELGVFAMTDKGLKEVANPSAIFLQRGEEVSSGSVVMVVWEGTRPLLVELQALVDDSHLGNPRRVTVGLDHNRLSMLLAVLHRHGGIAVGDQDVFVNVVGGVKVLETSADLALILSVISSFRDQALPQDLVVFGEVGLAGEIRPVANGQERLREAAKHGFTRAIVPAGNVPKQPIKGMTVIPVRVGLLRRWRRCRASALVRPWSVWISFWLKQQRLNRRQSASGAQRIAARLSSRQVSPFELRRSAHRGR